MATTATSKLLALLGPVLWLVVGCGDRREAAPEVDGPGPDCTALIAAGERALGCDPAIAELLTELRERPDERRCRAAARQVLTPPQAGSGRISSVYERPPATGDAPLTAAEGQALAELRLPGELVLAPDLAPRPGVPATTATLAGAALQVDADGRLRGSAAPGRHILEVRHANDRSAACVTLTACTAVTLTTHGALLAPHPAVVTGPCEPAPGESEGP